jgi:lipopolysaccharide transport system permease protein
MLRWLAEVVVNRVDGRRASRGARMTDAGSPTTAQAAPTDSVFTDSEALIVIEPRRALSLGIKGVWQYKQLVYFLAWRDVKIRYKQSLFGVGWAIIQPVLLMAIFALFFGRLAGLSSDNLPYPVFALAALVPWTLFANVCGKVSQSVVGSANLVSKIFFPRLAIPIATSAPFLFDFVCATGVLVVIQGLYGIWPTWRFVAVPFLGLLAVLIALSFGIWSAALSVRYRDVILIVPFAIQALMYASPIAYSASIVPERWQTLYGLNPIVGLVEGFRWAAAGADTHPGPLLGVSVGITIVGLLSGLLYFASTQRTFADVI